MSSNSREMVRGVWTNQHFGFRNGIENQKLRAKNWCVGGIIEIKVELKATKSRNLLKISIAYNRKVHSTEREKEREYEFILFIIERKREKIERDRKGEKG